MRRPFHRRIHSPSLLRRIAERLRGRAQMLVRGRPRWPLLLISYLRGDGAAAEELRDAWLHTLPGLTLSGARAYLDMLEQLPAMVVVQLRRRNVCTCLGHHHPAGTESRLAKRLAADMGGPLGEVDLAWEAIGEWSPRPLSSLAAAVAAPEFQRLHYRTAMLTVLLHELEHLAFPDRRENSVRQSSDDFYSALLGELLRQEGVPGYGMSVTL